MDTKQLKTYEEWTNSKDFMGLNIVENPYEEELEWTLSKVSKREFIRILNLKEVKYEFQLEKI